MTGDTSLFNSLLFNLTNTLFGKSIEAISGIEMLSGEWGSLTANLLIIAFSLQFLHWVNKSNGQLSADALYDWLKTTIVVILVLSALGQINPRKYITLPGIGKTETTNGFKRTYNYGGKPTLLLDAVMSLKYLSDSLAHGAFNSSVWQRKLKASKYQRLTIELQDQICTITDPPNLKIGDGSASYSDCIRIGPYTTKERPEESWTAALTKLPGTGAAKNEVDRSSPREPWVAITNGTINNPTKLTVEILRDRLAELKSALALHGGELSQLASGFKTIMEYLSLKGLLMLLQKITLVVLFIFTSAALVIYILFFAFSLLTTYIHLPIAAYEPKRGDVWSSVKHTLSFSLLNLVLSIGTFLITFMAFIANTEVQNSLIDYSVGKGGEGEVLLFVVISIVLNLISSLVSIAFISKAPSLAKSLLTMSISQLNDVGSIVLTGVGTIAGMLTGVGVLSAGANGSGNSYRDAYENNKSNFSGGGNNPDGGGNNSNFGSSNNGANGAGRNNLRSQAANANNPQGQSSGYGTSRSPSNYSGTGYNDGFDDNKIYRTQEVSKLESVIPDDFDSPNWQPKNSPIQKQQIVSGDPDSIGNTPSTPNNNVGSKNATTTAQKTKAKPVAKKQPPKGGLKSIFNSDGTLVKAGKASLGAAKTTAKVARFAGATGLKTLGMAGYMLQGNNAAVVKTAKSIFSDQLTGAKLTGGKAKGAYQNYNRAADSGLINSVTKTELSGDKTDYSITEEQFNKKMLKNRSEILNIEDQIAIEEEGRFNGSYDAQRVNELKTKLSNLNIERSNLNKIKEEDLIGSNLDNSNANEYVAKVLASGNESYKKRRSFLEVIAGEDDNVKKSIMKIDKTTDSIIKQIEKEKSKGKIKARTMMKISKLKQNNAIDIERVKKAIKKKAGK